MTAENKYYSIKRVQFDTIRKAKIGISEFVDKILKHYNAYICALSMLETRNHWHFSKDLYERLQVKLMELIFGFEF